MSRPLNLAIFAAWLTVLVAEQRVLKVQVTTWNVKSVKNPPDNLGELLGQWAQGLALADKIRSLDQVKLHLPQTFEGTPMSSLDSCRDFIDYDTAENLKRRDLTWDIFLFGYGRRPINRDKTAPARCVSLLGAGSTVPLQWAQPKHTEANGDCRTAPDIVILGLQEVTMNPVTAFLNKVFKDKWSLKIKEVLSPGYTKVKTKVSVSVALIVYVKNDLISSVGDIESSTVKTGLGGLYGNKGGVIISFRLLGRHFEIVNSHLHAHDGEMNARISDWEAIENDREKISSEPQDYLFWIGDLNFRIADNSLDADTINNLIIKGQYKEVLEKDELNQAKQLGLIFNGWSEAEIKFNPTYKVIVGDGSYNLKRRPAWTDRILYKSNTGMEIINKNYHSVDGFLGSDHKPVIAQFELPIDQY